MMDSGDPDTGQRLEEAGEFAKRESAVEDRAGSPTWPIEDPTPTNEDLAPPVGLNWGTVSSAFALEPALLRHDGSIVVAGEYFPASGIAIDPADLTARFVDVGEMALEHTYFVGELGLRNFKVRLPAEEGPAGPRTPIKPAYGMGPIIGLFTSAAQAQRAKERILQGSLGSGVSIRASELGQELRVEHPELAGRVCSVIAGHRGAVISIGGIPVRPVSGAIATGQAIAPEQADVQRPGTGVTSDVQARAREWGSSEGDRP